MLYEIWRNEPEELGALYLNHLIVEPESGYEFIILHNSAFLESYPYTAEGFRGRDDWEEGFGGFYSAYSAYIVLGVGRDNTMP